jgi:hypothetical protein
VVDYSLGVIQWGIRADEVNIVTRRVMVKIEKMMGSRSKKKKKKKKNKQTAREKTYPIYNIDSRIFYLVIRIMKGKLLRHKGRE